MPQLRNDQRQNQLLCKCQEDLERNGWQSAEIEGFENWRSVLKEAGHQRRSGLNVLENNEWAQDSRRKALITQAGRGGTVGRSV